MGTKQSRPRVAGLLQGQMAVLSLCKESSPGVAGTVNLGVGHGGRGLTCFIALGRGSDSKPKGWAWSGSLWPMGLAGPLSTSASQEASLLARPYSLGFAAS